jgi:membrane protein
MVGLGLAAPSWNGLFRRRAPIESMTPRLFLKLFWKAIESWYNDSASRYGAALAYYTLFALAPVLLVVIAIAGLFFGAEAVRGEIVGQIAGLIGKDSAEAVQSLLQRASQPRDGIAATVTGGVAFLLAVTGAFLELQAALNMIWRVKTDTGPRFDVKGFVIRRLRSLGMVVSIAFLLMVSLTVSAGISALNTLLSSYAPAWPLFIRVLGDILSLAITTALFALLFRVLPDVHLKWGDVGVGALATAILFIVGQRLIGFYLGNSQMLSPLGATAAVAVIMVWVYYSTQIVLLGAEFTYVYTTRNRPLPAPSEDAKRDPRAFPAKAWTRQIALVRTGRLPFAVFLTMVCVSTATAQTKTERRPLVTAVQVNGVTSVDRSALLKGLATRPTQCKNLFYTPVCLITHSPVFAERRYLDPVEMRRDEIRIRLFYWRRGYRDVVVTSRSEPSKGGVRVVFDVNEKDPTVVEELTVTQTDSVLSPAVITSMLQLRAKEPLDLVAVDSSIFLLREALWERGYADGRVTLDSSGVSNERNSGPVTVKVEPGPRTTVKEIEISGNSKISERTIRRLLRFKPGDLYRRSDVLETQRELYLSGLFKEVEIGTNAPTDSSKTDSSKTVTLHVEEAQLHQLDLATGFTTADFLQLQSDYTRYNFLGSARRLTIRGTLSNLLATTLNGAGAFYDVTNGATGAERERYLQPTWAASVEFTQPWFFSAHNQFRCIHLHSPTEHSRCRHGQGWWCHDRPNARSSDHARTRRWATPTKHPGSTRPTSTSAFPSGVCVQSAIRAIAERHPLSPLSLVAQYDGTNDPFAPNRGVRARADFEHGVAPHGIGIRVQPRFDDREHVIGACRRSRSSRVASNWGWVAALSGTNDALGLEGDTAELVVHPRKQFFSGGSQSVRGYGENQLGPRVLTIDPNVLSTCHKACVAQTDTTLKQRCSVEELQDGVAIRTSPE